MSASRRVRRLIVVVTFDGVNMLDFSGTTQVFATTRDLVTTGSYSGNQDPYEIILASSKGGLIRTSSGSRSVVQQNLQIVMPSGWSFTK